MSKEPEKSVALDSYALGENLRIAREHVHLSQDAVAGFLGLSPSTVYRFEVGKSCPTLGTL